MSCKLKEERQKKKKKREGERKEMKFRRGSISCQEIEFDGSGKYGETRINRN